jgi:coenzyme Q-binding protein COQ10
MRIERVGTPSCFSREEIFDLAADVERYPEFLHFWKSALIVKREPDRLWVEQVLGFGPVRLRFTSAAMLRRPERIEISSSDPLFRECRLVFSIAPAAPVGCTLSLQVDLSLRSTLVQPIVERVLGSSIDGVVAAFEARAQQLYPRRVTPPFLPLR